jgi:hypothetical protein
VSRAPADHQDPAAEPLASGRIPRPLDLGAAGGRGRMLRRRRGARIALGVLLVVLALGSIRGLLLRNSAGDPHRLADQVAARLGHTQFPVDDAGVWAARFTYAYLSFDQASPDGRRGQLATYVTDRVLERDPQLGWNGKGKQLTYLAYPVDARVRDDEHAIITIDAWLSDGTWRRLEVPVKGGRDGRFAVIAAPTFVEPPTKADADADPVGTAEQDTTAVDELKQALPSFLAAYASSNTEQLAYYTPPGTVLHGLAGAVTFKGFSNLRVPVGAGQRVATVTVTWQAGDARLSQPYQLTVVHRDRWLIANMQAAGHP